MRATGVSWGGGGGGSDQESEGQAAVAVYDQALCAQGRDKD